MIAMMTLIQNSSVEQPRFQGLSSNWRIVASYRLSLKVGRGRGTRGLGDVGTWGLGDAGTWGLGDLGTRGLGDVGTRGRGDVGTRGLGDARGFEDVINK